MKMVSRGSTGPEVGLLRRLLNKKLTPTPSLSEANIFGARYNGAVATMIQPEDGSGCPGVPALEEAQGRRRIRTEDLVRFGLDPGHQQGGNLVFAAEQRHLLRRLRFDGPGQQGQRQLGSRPPPPMSRRTTTSRRNTRSSSTGRLSLG